MAVGSKGIGLERFFVQLNSLSRAEFGCDGYSS